MATKQPKTTPTKRSKIVLSFPPAVVTWLEAEATKRGLPTNDMIRSLIDLGLQSLHYPPVRADAWDSSGPGETFPSPE